MPMYSFPGALYKCHIVNSTLGSCIIYTPLAAIFALYPPGGPIKGTGKVIKMPPVTPRGVSLYTPWVAIKLPYRTPRGL